VPTALGLLRIGASQPPLKLPARRWGDWRLHGQCAGSGSQEYAGNGAAPAARNAGRSLGVLPL